MRAIPSLKISISGVRGVVGDSLTPELVTRFAQAFGTYVGGGRVVIGRDPRTSGEMVRQAVLAGLASSGCRVADLGVCPTPTVQLLVRQLGAQGGIAITASHNPPEWNALKFVGGDGLFLSAARGRELLDIYHQGAYAKARGRRPAHARDRCDDAVARHVRAVVEALGPLPRERRGCGSSSTRAAARPSRRRRALVEALGARAGRARCTRPPTAASRGRPSRCRRTSASLCEAVRASTAADVGFAQDMDGDRLAIVDETGRPIGEELTLVLAAEPVLRRTPGPLVANLATTDALDAMAARHGCRGVPHAGRRGQRGRGHARCTAR